MLCLPVSTNKKLIDRFLLLTRVALYTKSRSLIQIRIKFVNYGNSGKNLKKKKKSDWRKVEKIKQKKKSDCRKVKKIKQKKKSDWRKVKEIKQKKKSDCRKVKEIKQKKKSDCRKVKKIKQKKIGEKWRRFKFYERWRTLRKVENIYLVEMIQSTQFLF